MKIVYKELVTVESNLHKAYYQVEDFDLNEWDIAFKRANGKGLMSWEHNSENKSVIVTIEADKQSASEMANTLMFSCLASSFEDFEISKSDDDYVVFSFGFHLSPNLQQYIFGQMDKLEDHLSQNQMKTVDIDAIANFIRLLKEDGLEKFLGYLSIHPDSNTLKSGEEILETGSPNDFIQWLAQLDENAGNLLDKDDIFYRMVSDPLVQEEVSDEDIDSVYKSLTSCKMSHKIEYKKWREMDRLQRTKYRCFSIADMYRQKVSLELLFSLYDCYSVDFFDYMFRAMNSEKSVMQTNQDLVDNINKFPNPRLAEIANERYKEYKKWDRNCLDLEFKSIHPEIKMDSETQTSVLDEVAELTSGKFLTLPENHKRVLLEVAELISDKSLMLPENYSFRDEKWFSQEMVTDVPCMHLKSSIKSEDGRNKSEDGRKFCILLNAMAKLGYIEDNEENLKLMAQALSGFGNEGYKPVMLRKRNGKGTTSRAIWFLLQEIVDFSTPEGKREKGEDYGSKYEIAKNLFNFRDWDEQNYFTKTERNSRNPGHAKEDIKRLLKIIYDIKPSPKKKKIRSK